MKGYIKTMSRIKPVDVNEREWQEFVEWADNNGIGEAEEDWTIWWQCFDAGYDAACRLYMED